MGRRTEKSHGYKSHTLPSSPAHSSSSSSDFEFRISISPRRSSAAAATADELFYKGQLLPLHLHPRLSMVQSLLLSSPSSSSATTSRDSTASSSTTTTDPPDPDSSRPSSATDDEDLNRRPQLLLRHHFAAVHNPHQINKKPNKYFSLSRLSSVFKPKTRDMDRPGDPAGSSVKRVSTTAREVIRRYMKKVKPLYEKLSQKQQQKVAAQAPSPTTAGTGSAKEGCISIWSARSSKDNDNYGGTPSHSFSGNLRLYPRRGRCDVASCPSSMRSSPSHSGVLLRRDIAVGMRGYADTSSMEELQSAIQGAILHCKNSLAQNDKRFVSNEI